MRRLFPATATATVLVLIATGLRVNACRYSIRDTGFVDLGAAPYRLELVRGSVSDSVAARFRQAAEGTLLDANLELALTPATEPDRAALSMTDGTGRRLNLRNAASLPRTQEDIHQLMQSMATSPRREDILRETLRSFAVVVLVEGTNASANLQARQSLQTAMGAVERLMPGMPKPVATPPQLVVLPVGGQPGEAVLIWGLGMDPTPSADPRVAIVYGRGRRLGAPLEGPMITRTAVQERLVMIGQDCECDLDRAWLKGPVLPGRWDRELQEIAARTLGFDPENPMIRTEVSRIVLRGEGDRSRQSRPTTAIALGYTEESVDAIHSDSTIAGPEDALSISSNGPSSAITAPMTPAAPTESSATPIWIALIGGCAAALGTGVWIARRGSKFH